jgi:hypothetical protein
MMEAGFACLAGFRGGVLSRLDLIRGGGRSWVTADWRGGVDGAMVVSGLDRRADRQRRRNGAGVDLFASKLRRPLMRPGTVRRSLLIERLARGDPRGRDYCEVAPQLQRVRGPHTLRTGLAAYEVHLSLHHPGRDGFPAGTMTEAG